MPAPQGWFVSPEAAAWQGAGAGAGAGGVLSLTLLPLLGEPGLRRFWKMWPCDHRRPGQGTHTPLPTLLVARATLVGDLL